MNANGELCGHSFAPFCCSFIRSFVLCSHHSTKHKSDHRNFIYLHESRQNTIVGRVHRFDSFNRSSPKYARLSLCFIYNFLLSFNSVVVWCNNSIWFFFYWFSLFFCSYRPMSDAIFLLLHSTFGWTISISNYASENVTQIYWCEKKFIYRYFFFPVHSFFRSKWIDPLSPNLINQSIQWHVSKWVY